jgi:TonB family protein
MTRWTAVLLAFLAISPLVGADDEADRPLTEAEASELARVLDQVENACEHKVHGACKYLERFYVTGRGIEDRPEKGRAFLRGLCSVRYDRPGRCMLSSTGLACRRLAEIYKCGEGVKKDLRMAAAYYRVASLRGDAVSSAALARLLEDGVDLPRDDARARAALRKACSQKSFLSSKCGACTEEVEEYQKAATEACDRLGITASEVPGDVARDDSDIFPRVGGPIEEPRRIVADPPVYPSQARQARVQGNVVVEAVVDVDGHVVDVRVKQGIPMLDAAAIAAVKQWVYTPTLLDGMPVPIILDVTVTFRLT